MISLGDRRLAELVSELAERHAESAVGRLAPRVSYGTVTGDPDTTTRTVAVALRGMPEVSPGFVYGEHAPAVGDFVRVVVLSTGDRYVDAILGRPIPAGSAAVVGALPEASGELRGELLLLEADAADDELYVCRRLADGTYAWVILT